MENEELDLFTVPDAEWRCLVKCKCCCSLLYDSTTKALYEFLFSCPKTWRKQRRWEFFYTVHGSYCPEKNWRAFFHSYLMLTKSRCLLCVFSAHRFYSSSPFNSRCGSLCFSPLSLIAVPALALWKKNHHQAAVLFLRFTPLLLPSSYLPSFLVSSFLRSSPFRPF